MTREEMLEAAKTAFETAAEKFGGKIKAAIDEKFQTLQDRVESLESRGRGPGKTAVDTVTREQREHTERFLKWLRKPHDAAAVKMLVEAQSEIEQKAVTTTTPAGGGYAVPEEISRDIEQRVKLLNPFRSLVRVAQAGTSRYHALVDMHDDEVGWVGEGDARSETGTSSLRDREPTFGTIYAYPKASEESLDDIFFDVRSWLTESAGDSFAAEEASVIVTGSGTKKPTGFLHTPPTTADDDASPPRDADAFQYFDTTSSPPGILLPEDVIAMPQRLKERYLMGEGVAWVMNRSTVTTVRNLKDSSGRFVWAESLAAGVPPTLCGYPVFTTDAMPAGALSPASFPIAFGNWRRAYLLADRVGTIRITVDDNITTPGQVKFYIRRRVGGIVLNNDAVKVLRF